MKRKVNNGRDRSVKVISCEDVVSSCALASSLGSSTHGAAQLHIAGSSKVNVPLEESRSGSMERSMTGNCEVPRITTSSKLKLPTISEFHPQEGRQSSVDTTSLYETEGRKIEDTKMSYDVFVDSTESTCQIKGCTSDLTSVNSYFRRNKVCQAHFKAFKVLLDDHEQRFCHQCNRFHMLSEFDEDRRSCKLSLKRQRTHPEATSVLSSGTLVYLPGKSLKSEENSGLVNASASENIERTATNEEPMKEETSHVETVSKTYEEETGHVDGAPTENTQKEMHGSMRGLIDPMVMPRNSTEIMKGETNVERPVPTSKNSESKKGSHVGSFANVCQVEGCMFDLSATKDYFRRHKVCEGHFKATTVLVKNVEQRFCQQCSRFHVLAEFEEGRKSCKRMLMGHNMRRRKGLMPNLNPKKGRRTRE